jgi:hypothetical protein
VDISRATMCGWVMRVGELLEPVVGAMRKELLAGSYIQADETPVDVQTHDKREQTDYMRRCHAAWEEARDAAPKEFHDYSARQYRGLMAFRAQTWTTLEGNIKDSEIGEVMSDPEIKLFLESLEDRLFVPVRS